MHDMLLQDDSIKVHKMKLQKADVSYIVYLNYINIISTLDYSHVLNIFL